MGIVQAWQALVCMLDSWKQLAAWNSLGSGSQGGARSKRCVGHDIAMTGYVGTCYGNSSNRIVGYSQTAQCIGVYGYPA